MGRNLEFVFGWIKRHRAGQLRMGGRQEEGKKGVCTYEMLNLRMDTRKSAVQSTGNTYSAIWFDVYEGQCVVVI